MRVSTDNIFNAIDKLRSANVGKIVSWDQIMAAVTGAGMTIKNWMTARGVLQYMINNDLMTRVADVHVEEYICNQDSKGVTV